MLNAFSLDFHSLSLFFSFFFAFNSQIYNFLPFSMPQNLLSSIFFCKNLYFFFFFNFKNFPSKNFKIHIHKKIFFFFSIFTKFFRRSAKRKKNLNKIFYVLLQITFTINFSFPCHLFCETKRKKNWNENEEKGHSIECNILTRIYKNLKWKEPKKNK